MPPHVHSLSQCRQDVLRPPSLTHISPSSGVTKLSAELYLNTDVYVTCIKHICVDRYDVMVAISRARARARVCVCVFMTGYVFADDGLIIRLWKLLILFHITSRYLLRSFRPKLRISLYHLLTNTIFVGSIDNV